MVKIGRCNLNNGTLSTTYKVGGPSPATFAPSVLAIASAPAPYYLQSCLTYVPRFRATLSVTSHQ